MLQRLSANVDLTPMFERIAVLSGGHDPASEPPIDFYAEAKRRNYEHCRAMSRRMSQMPKRFENATFDGYRRNTGNDRAIRAMENLIANGHRAGLGIYGEPGIGKSHLVSIGANAAIDAGKLTICTSVPRMLDSIRDTFNEKVDRQESSATHLSMVKRYASVEVLILNDLGKEHLTKWTIETLFAIFDDREEQGKPLIITSNLDWGELHQRYQTPFPGLDRSTGAAVLDRIAGMTGMPWIEMTGESQRWGVE